jgi:hypothetical protein
VWWCGGERWGWAGLGWAALPLLLRLDDSSSLLSSLIMSSVSFLLHLFILTPVSSNIVKRYGAPKGYYYAILFLAAVALSSELITLYAKSPNFYELLEVDRGSSLAEIKRSYKQLSLRYHPDKNINNPSATQQFQFISSAYEVLSDNEKRGIYDKYGSEALDNNTKYHHTKTELDNNYLFQSLVFYVMWFGLSYLFLQGEENYQGKKWFWGGHCKQIHITSYHIPNIRFITNYGGVWL